MNRNEFGERPGRLVVDPKPTGRHSPAVTFANARNRAVGHLTVPIGLGLLLAMACDENRATTTPAASTAASSSTISPPFAPASASASALVAAVVPLAPPSPNCVAEKPGAAASVTTVAGTVVGLAARGGQVYALTHEQSRGRGRILRVSRAGGQAVAVATHRDRGSPSGLVVTDQATLFSFGGNLLRTLHSPGAKSEIIADDFPWQFDVTSQHVYAVRCRRSAVRVELVRLPTGGGDIQVVASWSKPRGKSCGLPSVTVREDETFVSDWAARRVLRIDLTTRKVETIAERHTNPYRLIVAGDRMAFQSSTGVFRMTTSGTDKRTMPKLVGAPLEAVAFDGSHVYSVFAGKFAGVTVHRARLDDGPTEQIFHENGIRALPVIAVDDQCVFTVRGADIAKGPIEIVAHRK